MIDGFTPELQHKIIGDYTHTHTYPPPHMTCIYPPPHMTCNTRSSAVTHTYTHHMTCMYPPPHMTCMYPPHHMTCNTRSSPVSNTHTHTHTHTHRVGHTFDACILLLIWHACILLLIWHTQGSDILLMPSRYEPHMTYMHPPPHMTHTQGRTYYWCPLVTNRVASLRSYLICI